MSDLFQFEREPLPAGELVFLQVGHQLAAVFVGVRVQLVQSTVSVELLLVKLRGRGQGRGQTQGQIQGKWGGGGGGEVKVGLPV